MGPQRLTNSLTPMVLAGLMFGPMTAQPSTSSAAIRVTLTLRELTIHADVVVVAEPLDPPHPLPGERPGPDAKNKPIPFKVLKVLKGTDLKPGQTIQLLGMSEYRLGRPKWRVPEGIKPRRTEIDEGIVYLRSIPRAKKEKKQQRRFMVVHSGIRYRTTDGLVLRPHQLGNPGPFYLVPVPAAEWEGLLKQAPAEVEAVGKVLALKAIKDPAERNKAIFRWIRDHRREFGGNRFVKKAPEKGWGSLEHECFKWITASFIPQDCWEATKLYAEIRPGAWFIDTDTPAFGSPSGRALLKEIAFDPKRPVKERSLALWQLSFGANLWLDPREDHPKAARMKAQEQHELLTRLVPLLKATDPALRHAAVRAVRCACRPYYPDRALQPGIAMGLAALTQAYKMEPPGKIRTDLSQFIREVGGEEYRVKLVGKEAK